MVLCWMMMPRRGGRDVAAVRKIVGEIYDRNLAAWEQDNATFTGTKPKAVKKRPAARPKTRLNKTAAKGMKKKRRR
jgi:hypothetical protein